MALVLTLGAYWYLRPDPADEPAPPATDQTAPVGPVVADTAAVRLEQAAVPSGPEQGPGGPAGGTQAALLALVPNLSDLADRADLRNDATVREQRDNLTSATARLADGDAQASLRPGLVAAANLLRAVQQRAYPALDEDAARLVQQAGQLSGRDNTADEQRENHAFLQAVGALLQAENTPPAS
ncbi:hypothetical protein [Hymenobacter sp. PAMC 26628]|uniref:hypothetical protein n=1 Tax=Hymenobacter sp. PAMC 26628 TaxID=1484118 RepID=UPI0012FFA87B|nr:hypothetical protein [Hymenobacter sp. PAMC 26628]